MPSGKNLLNYGVAQAGHMIASVIDNGGLRVATTAPMNSWIGFRWKADIAPELHEGDKLTLSLEDGDTLNGICFQSSSMMRPAKCCSEPPSPRTT